MEAWDYIRMSEEVEKLRNRGIEIVCRVDNGVMKITAGRTPQGNTFFPEIPSVRYI
jgi:hypothetical protein